MFNQRILSLDYPYWLSVLKLSLGCPGDGQGKSWGSLGEVWRKRQQDSPWAILKESIGRPWVVCRY